MMWAQGRHPGRGRGTRQPCGDLRFGWGARSVTSATAPPSVRHGRRARSVRTLLSIKGGMMNNHHWCRRTVPAVLIAAVLGAAAHTASAAPTSDELAAARARLVEVTSQMPAGWPATEVMWEATEQPTL